MPWVSLDDRFPQHPKNFGLSDGAFRLYVSSICYSAQYMTDGRVGVDATSVLMPRFKHSYVDELIRKERWHPDGEGCDTETCPKGQPDSYVIHDYLKWNRSRAEVEAKSRLHKIRSDAGRKGAEARWRK